MNFKIVLPAILAVVVATTFIFVTMPIDKVSTVHTGIGDLMCKATDKERHDSATDAGSVEDDTFNATENKCHTV